MMMNFPTMPPNILQKMVNINFLLTSSLVLLLVFCHVVVVTIASSSSVGTSPEQFLRNKNIILLDVDNTLYEERYYGIERQIINNIHQFVETIVGETKEYADALHYQYGSTIEGLQQTKWKNYDNEKLIEKQKLFYNYVYNTVNVRSLLLSTSSTTTPTIVNTGYTHDQQQQKQKHKVDDVRNLLQSLSLRSNTELHIVSNSPMLHIQKVLQANGLIRIPWTGIWTPDYYVDGKKRNGRYPTKKIPTKFLTEKFIARASSAGTKITLIDDSITILRSFVENVNLTGIRVHDDNSSSYKTIQQAIGIGMDWWIDDDSTTRPSPSKTESSLSSSSYKFNDVLYLQTKNIIDRQSYNRITWNHLLDEIQLFQQQQSSNDGNREDSTTSFTIVDLGAGILSMLRLVIEGYTDQMPSLLNVINKMDTFDEVHYYAYEPNLALLGACLNELGRLGFVEATTYVDDETIYVREIINGNDKKCIVHLRLWDYEDPQKLENHHPVKPHLIIGCCFADLVQPNHLVRTLLYSFLSSSQNEESDITAGTNHNSTLLYFPITFCGTTQFIPSQPFETFAVSATSTIDIPSDTTAFALYSKALTEKHGHNLDPFLLENAILDYGGQCLHRGKSDWVIHPEAEQTSEEENTANNYPTESYLWNTMMYFFGTVAAPELQATGWDAQGWIRRARMKKPTIRVSNVDLLFRLPHLGRWIANEKKQDKKTNSKKSFEEILFTAPGQVQTNTKESPKLNTNEVRIQSVSSLISSGTELKIFKGTFDDDSTLDVNIKGMDDKQMQYPLAYGYSLVGRVVECGEDVTDRDEILGKLVFTFSPHASEVIVDRSAIQLIPDGIDANDAIFMPSVETALSLIQDARPILGEKVAVFGQGLIGLLITAILSKFYLAGVTDSTIHRRFGSLSAFDTLPDRLAASAAMGASQALFPSEAEMAGPFDLAIEVSGNSRALQTAIDTTRNGGRVVVGSWYGNDDVKLKLGIDFHRSQKFIKASQVSTIPPELSGTWSKQRRFDLTWDILHIIRPSRLLSLRTTLNKAQEAYASLDAGKEIAVAFEY